MENLNACGTVFGRRRMDACGHCGSMPPARMAEAIKAGIGISFADMKYGWPHKMYLSETYQGHLKFYTMHLKDATEEDRAVIEKACGLRFKFDVKAQGDVAWAPWQETITEQEAG